LKNLKKFCQKTLIPSLIDRENPISREWLKKAKMARKTEKWLGQLGKLF